MAVLRSWAGEAVVAIGGCLVSLEPLRVPRNFWSEAEVLGALRARDMGALFRLVAEHVGGSQTRLGAAVGLEQGYVSRVVAGRKITSIDVLERIADGLDMPDDARNAMGLAGQAAVRGANLWRAELWHESRSGADLWRGDVNRREVLQQAVFSSAAYPVAALRWLTGSPGGGASSVGSRAVGQPEVETIREVTATFRRLDNQYGGAHGRAAIIGYLDKEVTPLRRDGRYDSATGRTLLSAAAELTQLAGWKAYDTADHGLAQEYLITALDLARAAGDRPLGAEILAAMSHQATYLSASATGLDLARAAGRTARRVGLPALVAEAWLLEAHAHAQNRDRKACASALHAAEATLDRADRSADPQWIAYFDEAYMAARFGHCFLALRDFARAERFAARSLQMDDRYVRGRAFNLALQANALAQQGEPEHAVRVGGEALELTCRLGSARAASYIRGVQRQLVPYRSLSVVRRFQSRVDAALGRPG